MSSRTVIILGKTGHGKSSLANGLYGLTGAARQFDESPSGQFQRQTVEPQVFCDKVEDVSLEVIDTPGFFEQDMAMGRRWPDILRAFLLGSRPIDAIIVVVSSKELHSGARCVAQILDTIGYGVVSRTIICFSKYLAPDGGSALTKQDILQKFNQHVQRGIMGAHWVYYDRDDSLTVRNGTVSEILSYLEEIHESNPKQITAGHFERYTLQFFEDVVRSIPGEITLEQLQNESSIDMTLMRKFITLEGMDIIVNKHNEERRRCSIM